MNARKASYAQSKDGDALGNDHLAEGYGWWELKKVNHAPGT
jgi:hypothetical protein